MPSGKHALNKQILYPLSFTVPKALQAVAGPEISSKPGKLPQHRKPYNKRRGPTIGGRVSGRDDRSVICVSLAILFTCMCIHGHVCIYAMNHITCVCPHQYIMQVFSQVNHTNVFLCKEWELPLLVFAPQSLLWINWGL